MLASSRQIHDLNDLRNYVNETICNDNQLEIGAFRMTERILLREGRPCGLFFCLHGPRAVKLTAIWETDRNRILFYSPTGQRMHRTQLTIAPSLQPAGA